MTILALDLGSKKTGVAVSHGILAEALTTLYLNKSGEEGFIEKLKQIIEEQKVEQLVVGLPLSRNGKPTAQSTLIERQAKQISLTLGLPIEFCEETLTSWEAEGQAGKDKASIDAQAAKIILEQYLNEHRD